MAQYIDHVNVAFSEQLTAAITRSSHVAGRSNMAKTFNSVGWSCFVVVDARRAISLEGAILWSELKALK